MTRKIFEYYFEKANPKITWTDEDIKNNEKRHIGVRINNNFLKKLDEFSKKKKVNKNVIYHTAMEQFFKK